MKVLSALAMRQADQCAIEEFGIPGIVLMETAGTRVANFILNRFDRKSRVAVLCGPGNNGGDGLVIARLLHLAGLKVFLYSTLEQGSYRGDAAINENICEKMSLSPLRLLNTEGLQKLKIKLKYADLIVDALLGTGASRQAEGLMAALIKAVNQAGLPVVAVDLPSGIDADKGKVLGSAVLADYTLTFAAPKRGLFLYPGAGFAGRVYVCDINIPSSIMAEEKVELLTLASVKEALPLRAVDAHKGSLGKVLIVAGSTGMSGAAALAALAALKGGAGLVYLAAPASVCPALEAKLIEVIVEPLAESSPGQLAFEAAQKIISKAEHVDALCLGPGLHPGGESRRLLKEVIRRSPVPLVIDAGALAALAGEPAFLQQAQSMPIITPHPGEMAAASGLKTAEVQSQRLDVALAQAAKWQSIVVLKGANTIIAEPGGGAAINPTGGPALATAGTGDLLAGLITSFIAQGIKPCRAAGAAAYLHGLAGDLLSAGRGISALDILANFKNAFDYLANEENTFAGEPYLMPTRPQITFKEGF